MADTESGQQLEAIVVFLRDSVIHHVHPVEGSTIKIAWNGELQPGEEVVDAIAGAGLSPFLVHATSWRMLGGGLVLSFIVGIESPSTTPAGWADVAVGRAELARGHAMGPPAEIEAMHVIEHALRHLAWLLADDAMIGDALPDWVAALAAYPSEPFRAFKG